MRMLTKSIALCCLAAVVLPSVARAHCQVPCGIYADQRRFEHMLEDQATIAKAVTSMAELAGKHTPQDINQIVRWVTTKDDHATSTMTIIAEYFMAQRLKPGTDAETQAAYVKKLSAAHTVMTAAMKCKQTADAASAEALKQAIFDFYRAYEGKEPEFEAAP